MISIKHAIRFLFINLSIVNTSFSADENTIPNEASTMNRNQQQQAHIRNRFADSLRETGNYSNSLQDPASYRRPLYFQNLTNWFGNNKETIKKVTITGAVSAAVFFTARGSYYLIKDHYLLFSVGAGLLTSATLTTLGIYMALSSCWTVLKRIG